MAEDRLFYGAISNATIYANGSNTFIRIIGDYNNASPIITNISNVTGYLGIEQIIPGQRLVASTYFPLGTTVVSVNIGANTIEVEDLPDVSGTNGLARVSPPKGQYFISSGSLTRPINNSINFSNITGSEDLDFQSSDNKFGVLLQQASTSSLSSAISGEFAQYEISKVIDRQNSLQASFYITSSESGILAEETDKAPTSGITSFAIVELSHSSSLAPIFNQSVAGTPAGGYEVAAYQIAVQEFLDDLAVDIFYTGSEVKGNVEFINFSGSGVEDITISQSADGKTGVEVKLRDVSDPFPYTGSAEITGSLGVTGSVEFNTQEGGHDFFILKSGSIENFKVNGEGVTQFFAYANDYEPTAVLGGLYFQSSSAYIGLEQ